MSVLSYSAAFSALASAGPERTALIWEGEHHSRADLDRRSNVRARAFQALGVAEGDRVLIALPNSLEFVEAALAIWKLGALPMPVSSRLPRLEQRELVELAKPALMVGVDAAIYPEYVCVPSGFEPDASLSDGPLPERTSPHAQVITSGGSTGRPKLIVDALPGSLDPDVSPYGLERGMTVLVPGPLFHSGPFINARETLMRGGLLVLMSKFDAEQALALIAAHRVQWVNMVPTMLHRIMRLPTEVRQRADLSSLRYVFSSGAPCAPWLMRAWIEWIGPERMFEAYGGSERIGGTMISGADWLTHPGSVGKAVGGRALRVIGANGEVLPANEIGAIFMRPPGGQGSTYRYIGAQGEVTYDGWETLGDMGYLDADGFLYLVDRRTDMVVTGGQNVYPAEVEAALDAHPNVGSSAVVGLPDPDLGQRLHAIVEASSPVEVEELREHLAGRLVRYKIPRSYEFVATPLRDDAGKVRRSALREQRLAPRTE